jgi:hypothetical protein
VVDVVLTVHEPVVLSPYFLSSTDALPPLESAYWSHFENLRGWPWLKLWNELHPWDNRDITNSSKSGEWQEWTKVGANVMQEERSVNYVHVDVDVVYWKECLNNNLQVVMDADDVHILRTVEKNINHNMNVDVWKEIVKHKICAHLF